MVSHLFFYQLVLVGLVWLCLMLHWAWPSDRLAGDQKPSQPLPPRKRSSDSKPFPGLTCKPPCAACEQAHDHVSQPPGCPPPRIVPTRGRPRQVATSFHFCPNATCDYRGWVGLGNLSANGHPSSRPWLRRLKPSIRDRFFLPGIWPRRSPRPRSIPSNTTARFPAPHSVA